VVELAERISGAADGPIAADTRPGACHRKHATPVCPEPEPEPRLSIVVLPFVNLSNDPEQEYFADGITDDLTTDLSRISGSLVIARNTAFTYKGKPTDVKQIGRDLGCVMSSRAACGEPEIRFRSMCN
jgi:TolB-like protein